MARRDEERPHLTATFTPGGMDDYYLPPSPDVVSPAPQRIIQELPGQIQDSLKDLELGAGASKSSDAPSALSMSASTPLLPAASAHTKPAVDKPLASRPSSAGLTFTESALDVFPVLKNRTSNVPPSDQEKSHALESARLAVLGSPDPEVQLVWAQDALTFSDITSEYHSRLAHTGGARPSTPATEKQIRADATSIVSFLADQSHPKADFLKGMWLEFGKFGCAQDKTEAFRSYKRAAEKGYARAEYRMGMMFESTNQLQDALTHYRAGEAAGDAAACYRLGMMSLLGQLGQPQDYVRALTLIHYSADHADENAPQGAYVYGMLLARDLSQIKVPEHLLPLDATSARIYLERAAFLGFSKAQLKLGSAYELCTLGCDFNPLLSLHYNRLAARQGEPEAEMAISKWFLCGYENVFAKNEQVAYKYAERASADGLATAQFAMGYFAEIGVHVPVNLDDALQWYKKAAQNGSKDAQSRIEAVSMQRTLSKKDHEQIAVKRIQSTHASKRGGRPTPVAQQDVHQHVPITSQGQHTILPSGPKETPPYPQVDRPPVSSTGIAPYPVHDPRPVSVAPYPTNDDIRNGSFEPLGARPQSTANDGRTLSGPRPSAQISGLRPNPAVQRIPVGVRAPPAPTSLPRLPKDTVRNQVARPPDARADTYIGPPAADSRIPAKTPDFTSRPAIPDGRIGPPGTNRGRQTIPQQNTNPKTSSGPSMTGALPQIPKVPAKGGSAVRIERVPGKGPSTFDEMGIPNAKGDGDCIVM